MAMPWEEYGGGTDMSDVYTQGVNAKYTPDQMAELDRKRGELLRDEYDNSDKIDAGLVEETSNLQGTQKQAFEQADTSGEPWNDYKNSGAPWEEYSPAKSSWKPQHPVADIVGGLAAGIDTVIPAGAAIGGIHGLNRLATGQGLGRAVEAIEEDSSAINLGHLLEKYYPEAYEQYKIANQPLEAYQGYVRKAGEKTLDVTGSPGLATAVDVVGQALPFVLGERALSKGTIRPNARDLKKEKGYDPNMDSWEPTPEPQKAPSTFQELADRVKEAEDALPKQEQASFSKKERDAINKSRKAVKEPYDEALIENQNRYLQSEEGQRQLSLLKEDNDHPMIGESTESAPDLFDPISDQRRRTLNDQAREEQMNQAWEAHQRDQEIGQLLDYGKTKEDFNSANPDVLAPLVNADKPLGQTKRYGKQGGAVNFGFADEVAKRIQTMKDNAQRISRDRDEFGVGQQVRLMNGKIGTILSVNDGRYEVQGKGFKDSVPVQGIDYAYRPQGMNGFKQRGAIDLSAFRSKKEAEFEREQNKAEDTHTGVFTELYPQKWKLGDRVVNEGRIGRIIEEGRVPWVRFNDGREAPIHENLLRRPVLTKESGALNLGAFFGSKQQGPVLQIPTTDFAKLDVEAQRASADLRSWDEFKKGNGYIKHDKNGKEIPYQFPKTDDMSGVKALWQPRHILEQSNWDKATTKVFKNIASRISEMDSERANALSGLREHLKEYAALTRGEMKELTDVMIKYDGMNNQTLLQRGLQWMDTAMLKAEGLSDKQVKAYQTLTKGLDKSWQMIEDAFKAMGKDAPERIPGYFPHFWTGSWRAMIKDQTGKPIEIQAFATRPQRWWYMQAAERKGLITEAIDPDSHLKEANFVPELIRALEVFKNKKGLNGKILEKLMSLNEYTQRGIIKDVLEREGVHGYDAEKGISNWNKFHNDRLIKAYDTHFENVARFTNNVNIIKDVAAPLYRDFNMFENTPHFRDAVTDFIGRATGNEVNHIGKIDQLIRSTMMATGMPVHGAHQLLFELNRFMTWSKLNSTNVGFVVSNIVQPILAMGDLMQLHQDRVNAGVPTANPYKAMATLLHETVNLQSLRPSEFKEAVEWAYANNKIDTSAPMHLDPLKNSSIAAKLSNAVFNKLGQVVEERGRISSFLAAYSYFKDVMPKREALEAASNRMNIMMGNYERMNASAMYTDYGITGTAFKPFAQLRNTYYGRAGQAINTMRNVDWHNPKSVAGAGVPFAIMMGSYLLGAGISGMLGAAEYDALVTAYNTALDPKEPLPLSGELARKAGLPDWSIFGMLGVGTGVNIGPSVAAPAFVEAGAAPGLQAGANMFTLAQQGVVAAAGGNPSTEKIYAAAKRLAPPMLAPWIEDYIANHQQGNVPHSGNFDATRPRTEKEDKLFKIFGKRPITEEDDRQVMRLNSMENSQVAKWKKESVNEIVSSILGYSVGDKDTGQLIDEALSAGKGFDAKSLRQNIKEELKRRVTPEYIRTMEAIVKSKNDPDKARKLQQIKELMR